MESGNQFVWEVKAMREAQRAHDDLGQDKASQKTRLKKKCKDLETRVDKYLMAILKNIN